MIIGIIVVIVFLSVLVVAHEFGHFITAKWWGIEVHEFALGFPPRLWGKKWGETLYTVNWFLFGGFVRIAGEDEDENNLSVPRERRFTSLSFPKRVSVIAAGACMNFLLGWLVLSIVFAIGIPGRLMVTGVAASSPAAAAGIGQGDEITAVGDAHETHSLQGADATKQFLAFVNAHRGSEVTIEANRGGATQRMTLVPRVSPPQGQGAVGIAFAEAGAPAMPLAASIKEGLLVSLKMMWLIVKVIGTLIASLFVGGASLETVTGPVGMVRMTAEAQHMGFAYVLQLLALISLNLAVFNIIPFPALDGGRIFFLCAGKIKGSPIPAKFERAAHMVGMAVLLLLMAVVTAKDLFAFSSF